MQMLQIRPLISMMLSAWEDMWRVRQEVSFSSCIQKQERVVIDTEHEYIIEQYTVEDIQIDMVNIKFLNYNHKSLCIVAKLKLISYANSAQLSFKIDTGSCSNISPYHACKIIFPR